MGTARTKANNKWNAKAYDRVNLVLKKDTSPTKDEVQAAADAEGVSLNAYIMAAISQQLNKEKPYRGRYYERERAGKADY